MTKQNEVISERDDGRSFKSKTMTWRRLMPAVFACHLLSQYIEHVPPMKLNNDVRLKSKKI